MIIDDFINLPDEMRNAQRWLLWALKPNKNPSKKPRKVPYYLNGNNRSGQLDTPADTANLSTFENAFQVLSEAPNEQYSGLGFALGPDGTGNEWQGIDLDHLSDHPELTYVVDDSPSYTEQSPSGNGVHVIGYGKSFISMGSNPSGIEAYSSGRFFTVTGEGSGIGSITCIADFVETRLRPLHSSKVKTSDTNNQHEFYEQIAAQTVKDLRSALLFMSADDRELWQKNGHRLKTLGEVGRGLWMDWSATSDKFDPNADSNSWNSFKPTHTSYKAIFTYAQKLGWVNPMSNDASSNEKGLTGNNKSSNSFIRVSIADVFTYPPEPQQYIWAGRIPYDELTLLAAHGGTGKSTFALQLAVHVATNTPFLGLETGVEL